MGAELSKSQSGIDMLVRNFVSQLPPLQDPKKKLEFGQLSVVISQSPAMNVVARSMMGERHQTDVMIDMKGQLPFTDEKITSVMNSVFKHADQYIRSIIDHVHLNILTKTITIVRLRYPHISSDEDMAKYVVEYFASEEAYQVCQRAVDALLTSIQAALSVHTLGLVKLKEIKSVLLYLVTNSIMTLIRIWFASNLSNMSSSTTHFDM